MLLDELRRILLVPGAAEFVKELLAQMRKYRCVFIGAFQEPSQIDDIDPALMELLLASASSTSSCGRTTRTSSPDRARHRAAGRGAARICRHPLIEHQAGTPKASYFTYFAPEAGRRCAGPSGWKSIRTCSTLRNRPGRCSTADAGPKEHPSIYEGVLAEVDAR